MNERLCVSLFLCVLISANIIESITVTELKDYLKIKVNESCLKQHSNHLNESLLSICILEFGQLFQNTTGLKPFEIANTICSIPEDKLCTKFIMKDLHLCLTSDQNQFLIHNLNSNKAILKYACDNDAKLLKNFLNSDFSKCNFLSGAQCYKETTKPLTNLTMETIYTKKGCRYTWEFLKCIINIFNTCRSSSIEDFITKVIKLFFKVLPCSNSDYNLVNSNK